MESAQGLLFAEQVLHRIKKMKDDRERMAYLVRMLWHAEYLWGGESISGADCSGSLAFAGYLLGYNIRVTADGYDKFFTDSLNGAIPEAGDVCIWYYPGQSAKHIAMFSDHLLIMDADRRFIDTPVIQEIADRPGQIFTFKRINLEKMRAVSNLGNSTYSIDEPLKPLFGIFKVEIW